jgi:hypothetical protein
MFVIPVSSFKIDRIRSYEDLLAAELEEAIDIDDIEDPNPGPFADEDACRPCRDDDDRPPFLLDDDEAPPSKSRREPASKRSLPDDSALRIDEDDISNLRDSITSVAYPSCGYRRYCKIESLRLMHETAEFVKMLFTQQYPDQHNTTQHNTTKASNAGTEQPEHLNMASSLPTATPAATAAEAKPASQPAPINISAAQYNLNSECVRYEYKRSVQSYSTVRATQ